MSEHHHHHHYKSHQMDDAELIKQEALRSKKRRQTLSKALFQLMCFLCIAILPSLCGLFLATNKDDIIKPQTIR